ncbi:uncharacterized protein [Rhodnius prolixus]|uniref:uncharacterized protein n=1 Tax=Rhodnius prolixus TaxID=13249 RepID=UPI003D18C850
MRTQKYIGTLSILVTDRSVANNKPDILVMDRKGSVAHIVDIAIPNDDNMQKSRGEKIRKYQDLSFQLREMYNLDKTTIAPIILSTSGLVPRTTVTAVNELGLSTDLVVEAQKAVLLDMVRIVLKFLSAAH